ncbi:vegetative cell wall protein gp1 [Drosophila innubila]|uniref:vegetative cell wall protein gp1 n=1 Tax=Drosophila innubila TaxID=198719 RepID=UPI00148C1B33|nr:vegetative cell wall protein gp1 [Drosophila innubila]
MFKLNLVLATVLLCFVFATAQVMPNSEVGRVTVQVPLVSNGKPVLTKDKVDQVEVAHVVEIKPGKAVTEEVVVPPVVMKPVPKVRNMRAVVETVNPGVPNPGKPNPGIPIRGMPNPGVPNPGMPNPGVPNPGMPNPGMPNRGMPNPGMTNRGMPNPGVPNPGMPNPGVPNPGMPNPGVPNPGMPNPGVPNPGMPNPSVPHAAASEVHPVVVLPPSTTVSPVEVRKAKPSRNCHQLLLADMTTTPMPIPPTPAESCDQLCTKFELLPICAHNGVCLHEFPNQCVMDTFNCKHRDLAFRAVDEDVCRMGLCSRRCKAEDLNM